MSRHDHRVYLAHMRDHAVEAIEFASGRAPKKSERHILVARAIERALELVGEAANRVDAESTSVYPAIPWRGLIGLRNVIVHGYDRVDYDDGRA